MRSTRWVRRTVHSIDVHHFLCADPCKLAAPLPVREQRLFVVIRGQETDDTLRYDGAQVGHESSKFVHRVHFHAVFVGKLQLHSAGRTPVERGGQQVARGMMWPGRCLSISVSV